MATPTAYTVVDYANTITIVGSSGVLTTTGVGTNAATGPITIGKDHRIIHIAALITAPATSQQRGLIRYTLGQSKGTTAPTPTTSSPGFMGDENWTIDLNDVYDQINLASYAADNGVTNPTTISYSISVLSKF